eukprot:131029_1
MPQYNLMVHYLNQNRHSSPNERLHAYFERQNRIKPQNVYHTEKKANVQDMKKRQLCARYEKKANTGHSLQNMYVANDSIATKPTKCKKMNIVEYIWFFLSIIIIIFYIGCAINYII